MMLSSKTEPTTRAIIFFRLNINFPFGYRFSDVTMKSETKSIAVFLLRHPLRFFAFGPAAVFEQLAHTPGRLLSFVVLRSSAAKPALPASVFFSRRRGARLFCGDVPVSSRYLGRDYVP